MMQKVVQTVASSQYQNVLSVVRTLPLLHIVNTRQFIGLLRTVLQLSCSVINYP